VEVVDSQRGQWVVARDSGHSMVVCWLVGIIQGGTSRQSDRPLGGCQR